jgi:hypothetical protein
MTRSQKISYKQSHDQYADQPLMISLLIDLRAASKELSVTWARGLSLVMADALSLEAGCHHRPMFWYQ